VDWTLLARDSMASSPEHGYEPSGSIKVDNFVKSHQIFMNDRVVTSLLAYVMG
jgi:hypothetical protein